LISKVLWPNWFPKVETTSMVGAVVSAVTSTYASIIDLDIKTFLVVISSIDRANWFTWSIFAMLTKEWNKPGFNIGKLTLPISLHSDP
tara:strand:+ start:4228 stop:4491 length:264 start_codon:yes stop_codon:yes gene_type:complete